MCSSSPYSGATVCLSTRTPRPYRWRAIQSANRRRLRRQSAQTPCGWGASVLGAVVGRSRWMRQSKHRDRQEKVSDATGPCSRSVMRFSAQTEGRGDCYIQKRGDCYVQRHPSTTLLRRFMPSKYRMRRPAPWSFHRRKYGHENVVLDADVAAIALDVPAASGTLLAAGPDLLEALQTIVQEAQPGTAAWHTATEAIQTVQTAENRAAAVDAATEGPKLEGLPAVSPAVNAMS